MIESVTFQRVGSISNSHVGSSFERDALRWLSRIGLKLKPSHRILLGVGDVKKEHAFDMGCSQQKVIVECKSHRWTAGTNVPSAKLTVWNEAMYYFHLAPADFRKIMFVLKDPCGRRGVTLAQYYLAAYSHLVPTDVEFWEYDDKTQIAERIQAARARA